MSEEIKDGRTPPDKWENFLRCSATLDGNDSGMKDEGELEARGEKWLLLLIRMTAMTPLSHQGIVGITLILLGVTT